MTGLNVDDDLELSSIVIRADYSNNAAWESVRAAITAPIGAFRANLICIESGQYDGLTPERLLKILPKDFRHTFVFIVDGETLAKSEHPVLVVDVFEKPGRTFRVIPGQMWAVQNNLKLANVDWEDFSDATDSDGVFRRLRGQQ